VNYSSFFALDNLFVISASPELFLKVKNKKIISQPIKGTAPRGKNPQEDKKIKESLKNSLKEKAENLMIVDLMRNDFSRFCVAGSVKVQNLFKLSTYQNLHHLSSEIHGKILPELDNVDVLAACFPPGSMTGAPKIKAIEVAANYEKLARGVYSGCIGYFKGNDEMNLAVVIRTAVLQDKKFEFQAGGAITYESEAQKELEEVFVKSRNIKELLFL
jgi:para-aminobenzoate synthetase component 1